MWKISKGGVDRVVVLSAYYITLPLVNMQDNMFYAQLITINRHHVVVCTLLHCELYNGVDIIIS